MGHERVGYLPKSKKWRAVVAEIADCADQPAKVSELAANTLAAIGERYSRLAAEASVQASFAFLVDLARSAATDTSLSPPSTSKGPLQIAQELERELPRSGSLELRALAHQAATDAVIKWTSESTPPWGELFIEESSRPPLQGLGTGAGFSEVARLFFASLTERYLKYFLEREASAVIPHLHKREVFGRELDKHIAQLSRHAFETTKITQSFAAGWFNKRATAPAPPSRREIHRFLSYVFSKLREDIKRSSNE